jgi:hypothetical protein
MTRLIAIAAFLIAATACNNSPAGHDAGTTADSGPGTDAGSPDGGIPAQPALKSTQVDRMGRAGVNTALTAPFASAAASDTAKNAYNAQADRTMWQANFAGEITQNIAIYDGLDGVCGNQLLAGPTATAGRYDTLGAVLTDDVLSVNSASGTCMQYLAVEANATNVVPNTDCGGRTPLYNTIDVTYSVLATGMLTGVTNGITMDGDGHASTTTFPFLDAPNQ